MNTDQILDMIVTNYIWFIIGGGILLMAIIGFVADKKKILSKKNKHVEKQNDEVNLPDENEDNTDKTDENYLEQVNTNEEIIDEINNESSDDNKLEAIQPTVDESVFQREQPEEIVNPDDRELDDYSKSDSISDEVIDQINYIDQIDTQSDADSDMDVSQQDTVLTDSDNVLEVDDELASDEDSDYIVEKVVPEDNDFNQSDINDTHPDVEVIHVDDDFQNNYTEDSDLRDDDLSTTSDDFENSAEQIKEINDKEELLNISYSKLKEMVEDIIADNERKSANDRINHSSDSSSDDIDSKTPNLSQLVKQDVSPNLDQNIVDNIKQLDDDEDDVWKF